MRVHLWTMVSLCMRARMDSSGAMICIQGLPWWHAAHENTKNGLMPCYHLNHPHVYIL